MSGDEIADFLRLLKAAHRETRHDPAVSAVEVARYRAALARLDDATLRQAFADGVGAFARFPEPDDLLALVAERADMDRLEAEAWEKVRQSARMGRVYYATNGGDAAEPEVVRARFLAAYGAWRERAQRNLVLGPFAEQQARLAARVADLRSGRFAERGEP